MMRSICLFVAALACGAPSLPRIAAQQPNGNGAVAQPAGVAEPPTRPFPPLGAEEQARLQQVLAAWEQQSRGTKTLECAFHRWRFDPFSAPAGKHASKSDGTIKYAAPDKGLFRVDQIFFFAGMVEDKPTYGTQPGQFGEWWVCTGKELMEFDRSKQECQIQSLPEHMQGQNIFNSPLPFVFNLDAQQIQQRYWMRQVASQKAGIISIEAWPKRQEDRAQYRLVHISLDQKTLMPVALRMYAPNFSAKHLAYDHYEFTDFNRNSIGQKLESFLKNFIDQKPPSNWKVLHDNFVPPADNQRTATAPSSNQPR